MTDPPGPLCRIASPLCHYVDNRVEPCVSTGGPSQSLASSRTGRSGAEVKSPEESGQLADMKDDQVKRNAFSAYYQYCASYSRTAADPSLVRITGMPKIFKK